MILSPKNITTAKMFLKNKGGVGGSVSCLLAEENCLAKLSNNCPATLQRRNVLYLVKLKRQRERKIANVQTTLEKVCVSSCNTIRNNLGNKVRLLE